MPSPDTLELAKLIAPIPGPKPTGDDLRGSAGPGSAYYQVKDARNTARAAERQVEGGAEDAPTPEWRPVVTAASKALAEKTKDLEVVAYLIEGQCRTHGFAGLRDGFKVARELCEQFWDDLYPTPDEEGVATRVAPLTGLNGEDSEGTLIAPLNRVPLTEAGSVGPLTYANYLQAAATSKILDPKVKEKKIAAGAMSSETIAKAVEESSAKFFKTLYDDLTAAIDEYAKLNAVLDGKCGPAAPPTSAIRSRMSEVLDAVKDMARAKLDLTAPAPAAPADGKGAAEKDGEPAAGANGKAAADEPPGERLPVIRTREDALTALQKVSDYFRRTEPHTVVSYSLEQAVRWGRMPLPELMAELIGDEAARKALFKQVGIRPPDPPAAAAPEGKKK
jgi:type VI secretion system protein ImpA